MLHAGVCKMQFLECKTTHYSTTHKVILMLTHAHFYVLMANTSTKLMVGR